MKVLVQRKRYVILDTGIVWHISYIRSYLVWSFELLYRYHILDREIEILDV